MTIILISISGVETSLSIGINKLENFEVFCKVKSLDLTADVVFSVGGANHELETILSFSF